MLELKFMRENVEMLKEMLKNRNSNIDMDAFVALDAKRREVLSEVETLKRDRNNVSAEIANLKKEKKDASHLIEKIISFYFRDEKDDDFKPYFILNDILRFWRTLCLNYEVSRTQHKNWEKKNISLKFSRRLTVFATIAYIFSLNITSKPDIISMIKMSPLTRLSIAIEKLGDKNIKKIHKDFLDKYMKFLDIKEKSNTSGSDDKVKKELNELGRDPIFKELIYKVLLHENIKQDLRLFLVS